MRRLHNAYVTKTV